MAKTRKRQHPQEVAEGLRRRDTGPRTSTYETRPGRLFKLYPIRMGPELAAQSFADVQGYPAELVVECGGGILCGPLKEA